MQGENHMITGDIIVLVLEAVLENESERFTHRP